MSWAQAIALRLSGRGGGGGAKLLPPLTDSSAASSSSSDDDDDDNSVMVAVTPGTDVALGGGGGGLDRRPGSWTPPSIESTIVRPPAVEHLNHLIIVAGHAIWKGPNPRSSRAVQQTDGYSDDDDDDVNDDELEWARARAARGEESDWILTPYQRGNGAVGTFFRHIERGVEEAVQDSKALLVFSGGQTRAEAASIGTTEGQSYLRLASSVGLLGRASGEGGSNSGHEVFGAGAPSGEDASSDSDATLSIAARTTTEDYALDSFQNLLFSLARFREVTGSYPTRVTVVGYEMKRARFETLHRAALRIPPDRFRYIGIDDQGDTSAAYEGEVSLRAAGRMLH